MSDNFYRILRKLLFTIDPEVSHNLAVKFIARQKKHPPYSSPTLKLNILGKEFQNPLGMAAGFDKYATCFQGLPSLGFSFAELGTFTPKTQVGNDKPRLFRVPNNHALVNRMGFNNPGIEAALANYCCNEKDCHENFNIAFSIGKQKTTSNDKAIEDYLNQINKINTLVDKHRICYITINISSPNTPDLRELQTKSYLTELLGECKKKSDLPILVKLAPDFESTDDFQETVEAALDGNADGFIISNTTTNLSLLSHTPKQLKGMQAGLSGFPLRDKARALLQRTREIVGGSTTIIASGAIMTREDVWDRLVLGANLVQVYTGLIYGGPRFVYQCLDYCEQQLEKRGMTLAEFQKEKLY